MSSSSSSSRSYQALAQIRLNLASIDQFLAIACGLADDHPDIKERLYAAAKEVRSSGLLIDHLRNLFSHQLSIELGQQQFQEPAATHHFQPQKQQQVHGGNAALPLRSHQHQLNRQQLEQNSRLFTYSNQLTLVRASKCLVASVAKILYLTDAVLQQQSGGAGDSSSSPAGAPFAGPPRPAHQQHQEHGLGQQQQQQQPQDHQQQQQLQQPVGTLHPLDNVANYSQLLRSFGELSAELVDLGHCIMLSARPAAWSSSSSWTKRQQQQHQEQQEQPMMMTTTTTSGFNDNNCYNLGQQRNEPAAGNDWWWSARRNSHQSASPHQPSTRAGHQYCSASAASGSFGGHMMMHHSASSMSLESAAAAAAGARPPGAAGATLSALEEAFEADEHELAVLQEMAAADNEENLGGGGGDDLGEDPAKGGRLGPALRPLQTTDARQQQHWSQQKQRQAAQQSAAEQAAAQRDLATRIQDMQTLFQVNRLIIDRSILPLLNASKCCLRQGNECLQGLEARRSLMAQIRASISIIMAIVKCAVFSQQPQQQQAASSAANNGGSSSSHSHKELDIGYEASSYIAAATGYCWWPATTVAASGHQQHRSSHQQAATLLPAIQSDSVNLAAAAAAAAAAANNQGSLIRPHRNDSHLYSLAAVAQPPDLQDPSFVASCQSPAPGHFGGGADRFHSASDCCAPAYHLRHALAAANSQVFGGAESGVNKLPPPPPPHLIDHYERQQQQEPHLDSSLGGSRGGCLVVESAGSSSSSSFVESPLQIMNYFLRTWNGTHSAHDAINKLRLLVEPFTRVANYKCLIETLSDTFVAHQQQQQREQQQRHRHQQQQQRPNNTGASPSTTTKDLSSPSFFADVPAIFETGCLYPGAALESASTGRTVAGAYNETDHHRRRRHYEATAAAAAADKENFVLASAGASGCQTAATVAVVLMNKRQLIGALNALFLGEPKSSLIERVHEFTDCAYTKHEHRETILLLLHCIKLLLNKLVKLVYRLRRRASAAVNELNLAQLRQLASQLEECLAELAYELQTVVIEQSDELDRCNAQFDLVKQMKHHCLVGDISKANRSRAQFHEQSEQLVEVCKMLNQVAPTHKMKITTKTLAIWFELNTKQLLSLAQCLSQNPRSRVAKDCAWAYIQVWCSFYDDFCQIARQIAYLTHAQFDADRSARVAALRDQVLVRHQLAAGSNLSSSAASNGRGGANSTTFVTNDGSGANGSGPSSNELLHLERHQSAGGGANRSSAGLTHATSVQSLNMADTFSDTDSPRSLDHYYGFGANYHRHARATVVEHHQSPHHQHAAAVAGQSQQPLQQQQQGHPDPHQGSPMFAAGSGSDDGYSGGGGQQQPPPLDSDASSLLMPFGCATGPGAPLDTEYHQGAPPMQNEQQQQQIYTAGDYELASISHQQHHLQEQQQQRRQRRHFATPAAHPAPPSPPLSQLPVATTTTGRQRVVTIDDSASRVFNEPPPPPIRAQRVGPHQHPQLQLHRQQQPLPQQQQQQYSSHSTAEPLERHGDGSGGGRGFARSQTRIRDSGGGGGGGGGGSLNLPAESLRRQQPQQQQLQFAASTGAKVQAASGAGNFSDSTPPTVQEESGTEESGERELAGGAGSNNTDQQSSTTEADKWSDSDADAIVRGARETAQMALSMYQFTKGEGDLNTTQDLFTQAELFAEEANELYKEVRCFSYKVPAGELKKELLGQLATIPVLVQQLQFVVKNPTVGKPATFAKVDSVIRETRSLMEAVNRVVTATLSCRQHYNMAIASMRKRTRTLSPSYRADKGFEFEQHPSSARHQSAIGGRHGPGGGMGSEPDI